MRRTWTPVVAAFVTASLVTLLGVRFFFRPIAEADVPAEVTLSPALGFFIYVGLCVALFHWMALQMRSAGKAAFGLAAAQFVLAADLALRGERGLVTLAASGVLLAVTWTCVAVVYSWLSSERARGAFTPQKRSGDVP